MQSLNQDSNRIFIALIDSTSQDNLILRRGLKPLWIQKFREVPNTPYGLIEVYDFTLGHTQENGFPKYRFYLIRDRNAQGPDFVTIVPHLLREARSTTAKVAALLNNRKELDITNLQEDDIKKMDAWFKGLEEDGYLN